MSERRMSGPEFAALAFRILGVIILLSGAAQGLFVLLSTARGGWSVWGLLAFLLSLAFIAMVAVPLILYAESLAARLFPSSDKTIAFAVSRRDLLACGLALVGVWLLATNLPYVARIAGEVLWSAEGTRRLELDPMYFRRAAFEVLDSLFACVAGWVLFRHAAKITDWWESRAAGDS